MRLIVGRVVRPHGIRGEVLVDVRSDDPSQRFAAGTQLATDRGPLTVEYGRGQTRSGRGVRLIVAFAEVAGRDAAEDLRGVPLYMEAEELPDPADPDEYLDHQLVGLVAEDEAGERIGEVIRIEHAPAADLLVLRRPAGGEALVPFVAAIVPEVDVAGGRLVLTPPEGLLDL